MTHVTPGAERPADPEPEPDPRPDPRPDEVDPDRGTGPGGAPVENPSG